MKLEGQLWHFISHDATFSAESHLLQFIYHNVFPSLHQFAMSSQLPVSDPSSVEATQHTDVTTIPPAQRPPFEIPRAPPPTWSPDSVIPYVKTGMMIELSTIPLYLYAMYSIKLDDGNSGTQTRAALRGSIDILLNSFY